MVYCPRCGTKNEEDAKYCTKCGAAISPIKDKEKRGDTCFGKPEKRMEEECFGIPYGGAIAGIIFGTFIILLGFAIAFGLHIWRWIGPLIVIAIGVLVIVVVISGFRRRR